jgi:hypothetical protein
MRPEGSRILDHLHTVAAQRMRRLADAALAERVRGIKAYQHTRFVTTYSDMLAHQRYARAARFFLEDLYGPGDFAQRDDQFVRIVPAMVRLFPQEIVHTVQSLAELHALSETLDSAMAAVLPTATPTEAQYHAAWYAVGQPQAREQQIALMLAVGAALDRYTRNPLLRHSLRLMRSPAHAAGLGDLQRFLETGFETFRDMRGAQEFLSTIASRERALATHLFSPPLQH